MQNIGLSKDGVWSSIGQSAKTLRGSRHGAEASDVSAAGSSNTPQDSASSELRRVQQRAVFASGKADQYLAAKRELLEQMDDPKRSSASKTYLDIAHYDQGPGLVDVFA